MIHSNNQLCNCFNFYSFHKRRKKKEKTSERTRIKENRKTNRVQTYFCCSNVSCFLSKRYIRRFLVLCFPIFHRFSKSACSVFQLFSNRYDYDWSCIIITIRKISENTKNYFSCYGFHISTNTHLFTNDIIPSKSYSRSDSL